MPFTLTPLPYDYSALEPHFDAKTMEIHHTKHHQAYVDKTNAALEGTKWSEMSIEEVISNINEIPEEKRVAVRNNGGGVLNHNIFWTVLSPSGGGSPSGDLAKAINQTFGSIDIFKEEFSNAAVNQFGSGWTWLTAENGKLKIENSTNQDNPLSFGRIPILCADVWEHAYYLKYQNRRPEYIKAFWQLVNWEEVERRLG